MKLVYGGLFIVFCILLTVQLVNPVRSWWLVFIPLIAIGVMLILGKVGTYLSRRSTDKRSAKMASDKRARRGY